MMTRKDRIEEITGYGRNFTALQSEFAWRHLMDNLDQMCLPDTRRNPRFADVLDAIRGAAFVGQYADYPVQPNRQ